MPRRIETPLPAPDCPDAEFSGQHFIDQSIDGKEYEHKTFSFCTFEKIGAKQAKFKHCVFKHCEFIDCYLAHAIFDHCSFTGSFFDRCVFSWAEFPESNLDYTNYMNCGPVLSQVRAQKPRDPQAAAKFFRNLAAEHKKLGNWEEVDKLILEAYRERERHFWYVITARNDHYRKKYRTIQRFKYLLRHVAYRGYGLILGYGVSWVIFGRTLLVFGLIIFPLLNIIFGKREGPSLSWDVSPIKEAYRYFVELLIVTTKSFMPFVPSPAAGQTYFVLPFWLSSIEAVFGTAMFAVFAALLFRWASKGN